MENKKLWFKRKKYGWGWYPSSREGWMITLFYLLIIIFLALAVSDSASSFEWLILFVLPVALLTISFMRIAYRYGEEPRWQWGDKKKKDN